eukprot:m.220335 g.220335  ORF g.220335 m.220335 type:complete len:333 (+) comp13830_c1_seq3:49-1047(+)
MLFLLFPFPCQASAYVVDHHDEPSKLQPVFVLLILVIISIIMRIIEYYALCRQMKEVSSEEEADFKSRTEFPSRPREILTESQDQNRRRGFLSFIAAEVQKVGEHCGQFAGPKPLILLHNAPRPTLKDASSRFRKLRLERLKHRLGDEAILSSKQLTDVIEQLSLFKSLSSTQIAHLSELFEPVHLHEGDYVLKQGEPVKFLFIVGAGVFSMSAKHSGVDIQIGEFRVGSSFGLLNSLVLGKSTSTIVSEEEGLVWRLSHQCVEHITPKETLVTAGLLRAVSYNTTQRNLFVLCTFCARICVNAGLLVLLTPVLLAPGFYFQFQMMNKFFLF